MKSRFKASFSALEQSLARKEGTVNIHNDHILWQCMTAVRDVRHVRLIQQ